VFVTIVIFHEVFIFVIFSDNNVNLLQIIKEIEIEKLFKNKV